MRCIKSPKKVSMKNDYYQDGNQTNRDKVFLVVPFIYLPPISHLHNLPPTHPFFHFWNKKVKHKLKDVIYVEASDEYRQTTVNIVCFQQAIIVHVPEFYQTLVTSSKIPILGSIKLHNLNRSFKSFIWALLNSFSFIPLNNKRVSLFICSAWE